MLGLMQDQPLVVSSLVRFAGRHHGDTEVVSRRVEADIHRTAWSGIESRAKLVANALDALGLRSPRALPPWRGTATATSSCISG